MKMQTQELEKNQKSRGQENDEVAFELFPLQEG